MSLFLTPVPAGCYKPVNSAIPFISLKNSKVAEGFGGLYAIFDAKF